MRSMETGISLGSNLGDRLAHLKDAKRLIRGLAGVRITAQSFVYETSPVDVPEQFEDLPFMNAVLLIETTLEPPILLAKFKDIEKSMGRATDADRNAPRPIDIDIIFAGNMRVDETGLSVPHPRWASRRFVVQPLCDLRPDVTLPGQNRTVRDLLSALPPGQKVVLSEREW